MALLSEPIQFGKYTLFERIGRGGMAEVFKGRIQGPAGFERTFVVKRILPHLSDDATFVKMFVDEAKMSARLNHANIVHVFELGAVGGEYFISMEYIRGHDLAETMRAIWKTMGAPRPELVAFIGREACRGLNYAHGLTDEHGRPLGMIHRDVSPSNVMLSYEGAVKLLDFGIAKALGEAPDTTKSGSMKGKYAYMAPEQTEGDDIDHRADIFSCGIVLHEVLTGRRLFKGANDVQTIERVRRCDVAPPSQQNPAVPPALDDIILRALAKNPNDRWDNAGEMADALDDIVHDARFQPTHLAQLINDLFPTEGGGTVPPRASATASHGSTTTTGRALRKTVPPVSRTASGYGALPYGGNPAAPSLKPRSRFPLVAAAVVLVAGGAGAWKLFGPRVYDPRPAVASDPQRRFHVFVKSDPAGADIYMGDKRQLVGSTPVSLEIDLTGVSSVHLLLKKAGYDDFDRIVTNDDPISISLAPTGGVPPPVATPDAGAAPAAAPVTDQSAASKHHPHKHASKSDSDDTPAPASKPEDDLE